MINITLNGIPTLVYAIFCDTIRTEIDQRFTLVGLLGPTLSPPSFPTILQIGILMRMVPGPVEGIGMDVSVLYDDHEVISPLRVITPKPEFAAGSTEDPILQMALDRIFVHAPGPGRLKLLVSFDGAEALEVDSLRILPAPLEDSLPKAESCPSAPPPRGACVSGAIATPNP